MKLSFTFTNPIYFLVFSFLLLSQSTLAQHLSFGGNPNKRTLALVIGISDYKHLNDLQFAHNDAEDFANFLTSKNGLNLPESDVRVYTNEKATQSKILYDGFQWLDDELNEGDEAFIFFSGHGDIYNKEEIDILKTGFLLTYESEEDKYETTALSMENFLKQTHIRARGKNADIRVILDVCHAGIGFKAGGIVKILEMTGQYDPNKEIIITSCGTDESSYEYEALQNGCFSYFFLEGLKGGADENNDQNITLDELKGYSEDNVKRYVKSRNNSVQFPQFKGDDAHLIARIDGKYQAPEIDEHENPGEGKGGVKKGVDKDYEKSKVEVERILDKIENNSLSSQEIESTYELYLKQPEKRASQRAAKRKMKRDLVAVMVDKADRALTTYFEKEGEMMNDPQNASVPEYYLKSAKLLGEDHFLYNELLGKYFFTEALKLNTQKNVDASNVIDKLNSSLTLEPNASYTLNELGNVYFAKEDYLKAMEYYQKANNISPTWGKNIIKTNNVLQQKHRAETMFSSNYPMPPTPSPYEIGFEDKLTSETMGKSSNDGSSQPDAKALDHVYQIQLAAAKKVNRGEFKKLEDLGPINPEFNAEKNLINTWMGPFDSEKEAKSKLKKVKERGFEDAFLVEAPRDSSFQKKLFEKRSELEKEFAAAMPYQVRIATVSTFNKTQFSKLDNIGKIETEPITVKGKTLHRVFIRYNLKKEADITLQKIKKEGFQDAYIYENKALISNSEASKALPSSYEQTKTEPKKYKIRIATVSKLVENQFSNLEDLGHIYMDVVHVKGLIRVSLGDFQDKQKATEALNKVKKLGYKDAFLQY